MRACGRVCVGVCVFFVFCFLSYGVTDQMNTTVHGTMGTSPFKLVFGQAPRPSLFPGALQEVVMEEDVEDILGSDEILSDEVDVGGEVGSAGCGSGDLGGAAGCSAHSSASVSPCLSQEGVFCDDEVHPGEVDSSSDSDVVPDSEGEVADSEGCVGSEGLQFASCRHLALRKVADERYRRNAEKLSQKYAASKRKKTVSFAVGDNVSVRVPRIDRSGTDALRVPGVVVDCSAHGMYKIGTAAGILQTCYRSGDLEKFCGTLSGDFTKTNSVSIREACRTFNRGAASKSRPATSCNCMSGCSSKRCRCVKEGLNCVGSCHSGRPCENGERGEERSSVVVVGDEEEEEEEDALASIRVLREGEELSDDIITLTSEHLRKQTSFCGLQPPTLLKVAGQAPMAIGECVQVHHLQSMHWLCTYSSGIDEGRIYVVDSIARQELATDELKNEIRELYAAGPGGYVSKFVCPQRQEGSTDCGLFALAFATELTLGKLPSRPNKVRALRKSLERQPFDKSRLRAHLVHCLQQGQMSPFPRSMTASPSSAISIVISFR